MVSNSDSPPLPTPTYCWHNGMPPCPNFLPCKEIKLWSDDQQFMCDPMMHLVIMDIMDLTAR